MKKFAKIVCVAAMGALLVMGLAACGNESGSSADKTYKIATDTTFAPFEFQNADGTYEGIDVDILEAVAADQGFKYELEPLGFDAALQAVQSGQSDAVIAGMTITDERAKVFDFSKSYYDSGVIMAVSSESNIASYDDLYGKSVAVKKGTMGAEYAASIADQYGFATVTFNDSPTMYQDVLAGNTVACFEDYPVMGYAITTGMNLKMVGDLQSPNQYGFAVSKGANAELLSMFDKGLENIKASGKYDEICSKYVSSGN